MTYRVQVTETAKAEVDAAYRWLAERTPKHSVAWFNGLQDAMEGLWQFPTRCGLARESRYFDEEIRQLLCGKRPHLYRILFIIRGRTVYVLHVRHAARRAMERGEIVLP